MPMGGDKPKMTNELMKQKKYSFKKNITKLN